MALAATQVKHLPRKRFRPRNPRVRRDTHHVTKRGRSATERAPARARRRLQRDRVCLKFGRRLCDFGIVTSWLQQCSWQQQQQQRQRQWHQQCGSRLGKVACLRICVATNYYTTTLLLYHTTTTTTRYYHYYYLFYHLYYHLYYHYYY